MSEWDGQLPSSALCLVDAWAQETVSDEREAMSEFSVPPSRDLGESIPFPTRWSGYSWTLQRPVLVLQSFSPPIMPPQSSDGMTLTLETAPIARGAGV